MATSLNSVSELLPLKVMNLGVTPYLEVWELQKSLQKELIEGTGVDTLIICQHPATITLGSSASETNILANKDRLSELKVSVFKIERGGDVTYHGPGQLILYPIIDLKKHKKDVAWYLRILEQSIIDTLSEYGLNTERISGKTGVWTKLSETGNNTSPGDTKTPNSQQAKIASIGVRISRWCTMHGLSLNIDDCSLGFSLINPCGYKNIKVTSCKQEGMKVDILTVSTVLTEKFKKLFGFC